MSRALANRPLARSIRSFNHFHTNISISTIGVNGIDIRILAISCLNKEVTICVLRNSKQAAIVELIIHALQIG